MMDIYSVLIMLISQTRALEERWEAFFVFF